MGHRHLEQKNSGYSLVELLVTIAIIAIIAGIAIPSFASLITREKVGSAADGLVRALEQTKAHAIQTGKRTQLIIHADTLANCDNLNVAWAIIEENNTTAAVHCLSRADFDKRFKGTSLTPASTETLTFTPLGIATNNDRISLTLASSERSKVIDIYPGGTTLPQPCKVNGVAGGDC